jgi:hypothetical protein
MARAVTRLVDGPPSEPERLALQAWAAEHPDVTREIAAQRGVASALRAGGPPAPESLIAAVEARVVSRRRPQMSRLTPARLTKRPPVAAAVAAALAAGILAVSLGGGAGHNGPSIDLAAGLAFSPATQPAPGSKSPTRLDVSYGGITFPNYGPRFDAVPTGQRFDRLSGRAALTVFYRLRDGARLSYTIYSGRPVPLPRATREVVFRGVHLHELSVSPHLAVVTLVRHGHTCVLAARASTGELVALAEAPLQPSAA